MIISNEQFANQQDYCSTILIAKSLLKEGLITPVEYKSINNSLLHKYNPIIKSVGNEPAIIQRKKLDF